MNIVIITPVAATPDIDLHDFARPRIPNLARDQRLLQEINIVELGKTFADLGHPTTIVFGDLFLDGQSKTLSNRLRVVPAHTIMHVPFHPGVFPMTPSLIRHQALREADVIQSGNFHQPSTFFACIAAREAEAPVVVWQETFHMIRFPGSWYQLAYEAIAGNYVRAMVRRFVPRTTEAHPYLKRLGVREGAISSWIPTGIDLTIFTPRKSHYSPEDFGWNENTKLLLLVARLQHTKGVDVALRILKRLKRKEPNIGLLIAGSGPEHDNLRRLANDLGIGEAVHFIGQVSRKKLVRLYNAADVVLCTSRNDLLPFALIEASACGRPCITVDVGAVRDIVVHGVTGLVVGMRAVSEFANAILSLLQDDELHTALGTEARRRMETHFDLPKVAGSLLEVYRGVCN